MYTFKYKNSNTIIRLKILSSYRAELPKLWGPGQLPFLSCSCIGIRF